MWKDAIDTANESTDPDIIEELMRFFCSKGEKECFCATLYTCYTHVSPDVVLELGWLNGYYNFIVPYFIQNLKQTHDRLNVLDVRTEPPKEDEKVQDTIANQYGQMGPSNYLMIGNGGMVPDVQPGVTSPHSFNGAPDMSGFATVQPVQQVPSPQNGYAGHPNMNMGLPTM